MRLHIRRFVEACEKYLDLPEPIYEFGALQVVGQRPQDIDLRPIFPNKRFVGTDFRDGTGVDMVLDLHNINLPDETIGAAISVETFEHVQYPWLAVKELYRVLRPGGVVVLTSIMHYAIHKHPNDYWRFTPEGFRSLLELHFGENVWVDWAGVPNFPHTVVAIARKGPMPSIDGLKKYCEDERILWKLEDGRACSQQ